MRTWARKFCLSLFLVCVVIAGLQAPAWANSELHLGARLFFPLWDVSTSNRVTFIVVTRVAMREGASFVQDDSQWLISGDPGKCLPRGANVFSKNVNRTDLGGTSTDPVFVDDVHFEYYGRSCAFADETVHMSCGDIDLFVLASNDNKDIKPRRGFQAVAFEGRGALDVHLVTNGQDPRQRKLENSLMGHAIIHDLAEGWVASYDAAAAKAVPCAFCARLDGGTEVGYENYPMEVYLPFAFAEGFRGSNLLALWSPNLLPGGFLTPDVIAVDIKYWDGRERAFAASIGTHALIRTLGNPIQSVQDVPAPVVSTFNVANYTCGHTAGGVFPYENDGFPRTQRVGGNGASCGSPSAPDPQHKSDNFESIGDLDTSGHNIQPSTPISHWRFKLFRDGQPANWGNELGNADHSGRGLVGVVLSTPEVKRRVRDPFGTGDATRLWHEDPCEVAQSGTTFGPPHARDQFLMGADYVALFNVFIREVQLNLCNLK